MSPGSRRADAYWGTIMPSPGPWEDTPRWMFWRPTKRRRAWRLNWDAVLWISGYEYQHPAFVAREFLEKNFGK